MRWWRPRSTLAGDLLLPGFAAGFAVIAAQAAVSGPVWVAAAAAAAAAAAGWFAWRLYGSRRPAAAARRDVLAATRRWQHGSMWLDLGSGACFDCERRRGFLRLLRTPLADFEAVAVPGVSPLVQTVFVFAPCMVTGLIWIHGATVTTAADGTWKLDMPPRLRGHMIRKVRIIGDEGHATADEVAELAAQARAAFPTVVESPGGSGRY